MTESGIPVDGERIDAADVTSLIPANIIAYTSDATAPTGWAEQTAVRGRMIVAMPNGGTGAGTVGTALTDLQDKTHTHTGPSHYHTVPYTGWSHAYAAHAGYLTAYQSTTPVANIDEVTATQNSGAGGTDASGTAATSDVIAYIQYLCIKKS